MTSFVVVLLLSLLSATLALNKLKTFLEWKYVDFEWESEKMKSEYIKKKLYIPENVIPYDVDVTRDLRFFVTVVRDEGVPATVMTVTNKKGDGGYLVKPYPNWAWNKLTSDCNGIVSVYRVAIDRCNNLWMVDNGKVGEREVCPAKILVFDLRTDRLKWSIPIPEDIAYNAQKKGLLVTPIVQQNDNRCSETTVYIADVEGYAIVVYKPGASPEMWRVDDYSFKLDPAAENITVAGESFTIQDGILGMALTGPLVANNPRAISLNNRKLYFTQLTAFNLMYAPVQQLQASNENVSLVRVNEEPLKSHVSTIAMSTNKFHQILFYSQLETTSIHCWNSYKEFGPSSADIIDMDETALQFPSGMKVSNTHQDELFVTLTNRYQKVATGTLDLNDTNFRILLGPVKDLVAGTKCV